MSKPRKDGTRFNILMDRNLYNRLAVYADMQGQTKTIAVERLLKKCLDEAGIPEKVDDPNDK